MAGNSGGSLDRASILERGYEKCAPELGANLEEVRRRFLSKTRGKRGTSHRGCGCRLFVGAPGRKKIAKKRAPAKRKKSYANFHLPKVGTVGAHQASYLLFRGPIPRGHEIHHDCLTNLCVEPQHLDALSPEEHAGREGRRRTARRPAPEPNQNNRCGISPVLRPRVVEFARRAGIEPWVVSTDLRAFVGEDEVSWFGAVVSDREPRPPGLAYVGAWADARDRMAGLAGACIRNFTHGVLMPRADVMEVIKDDDYPASAVLFVPDFGSGRLGKRRAVQLSQLLLWRAQGGMSTVITVPSLGAIGKRHGGQVRSLVEDEYLLLYGAATAHEKKAEMERVQRLAADAGLREESIGPLVSAVRFEAYSQARADKRDLDVFTLRFFLERALYREGLVQGCEAEGLDRWEAEALVIQERKRAAEEADGRATLDAVARRLQVKIGEFTGREAPRGPLAEIVKRLKSAARFGRPGSSGS